MPAAVPLRANFSASTLRRFSASSHHANQSRRLLSLAVALDRMNRDATALIGGMTVRHCVTGSIASTRTVPMS